MTGRVEWDGDHGYVDKRHVTSAACMAGRWMAWVVDPQTEQAAWLFPVEGGPDAAKAAAERYLAEREELQRLRAENAALCPIGDRPVIESLRMQLRHAGEALDEATQELAVLRRLREAVVAEWLVVLRETERGVVAANEETDGEAGKERG